MSIIDQVSKHQVLTQFDNIVHVGKFGEIESPFLIKILRDREEKLLVRPKRVQVWVERFKKMLHLT